jgi:hypothetical protein
VQVGCNPTGIHSQLHADSEHTFQGEHGSPVRYGYQEGTEKDGRQTKKDDLRTNMLLLQADGGIVSNGPNSSLYYYRDAVPGDSEDQRLLVMQLFLLL